MSTPVTETKPTEEQAPTAEEKQNTSTTSEEAQLKEKKEATAEPSTAVESAAMEVDSSQSETKPEATSGEETKPVAEEDGAKSTDTTNNDYTYRRNGASRKRFKWLLSQGYTRNAAAQLAKEPFKSKELRDKYVAETGFVKEQEVQLNDEEWKSLGSQAKKRLKWLLKSGYTEKEALKLCREPINAAIASKRNISANGGPSNKFSKRSSEVAGFTVMAVAANDYPTTFLTNAQTDEFKSAILKEVVQQKDSELKPHFESCVHVKGYLRVQCSDQETRRWLQHAVAKLTVPEGIALKVVAEKNLIKGDVYTGFFTDSRNDTNEAILEFVESQNEGISTSEWKILTRQEVKDTQTVELMFTVDQASAKSIHNLGYELNYKFNKIKIRKQRRLGDASAGGMKPQQRRPYNQPSSSFVPIWDSNLPQSRGGNNFNQFNNQRSSYNSGSGYGFFGDSNGSGGRSRSSSNRPFNLVDSLYDQLNLISGGGYGTGSNFNQWGGNNSGRTGRSSGQGNRNFTKRSAFF